MMHVEPSFVLYALLLDPGCRLRAHTVLIGTVEPVELEEKKTSVAFGNLGSPHLRLEACRSMPQRNKFSLGTVGAWAQALAALKEALSLHTLSTGAAPGRDPTPEGGGGGGLYGPQNCRTEQCALSAPEILF